MIFKNLSNLNREAYLQKPANVKEFAAGIYFFLFIY
jgi:hypothetical protein